MLMNMDSAQTWHEPSDVQRALEVTLKDLQLDYGNHNGFFEQEVALD